MTPGAASGAIQSPCPACGESAKPPPPSEPDRPWACSPCRAEWAQAIHISPRWPHHTPNFFAEGPVTPATLRGSLAAWAQALAQSAAWALELARRLGGDSAPEAVAHALMGGEPAWHLSLPPDTGGFVLTDVPPDVARRLAATCDFVDGPTLSTPELVRLRERGGRRETRPGPDGLSPL